MFLLLVIFTFISASEFKVFYVKKEFDFGHTKNLQKDYYVNIGSKDGVRKELMLNVFRKNQIVDTTSESKIYDTKVLVAKLKVISVDNEFCIARVYELTDLNLNPIAGYNQVMVGDLVELAKNDKNKSAFNIEKLIKKEPGNKNFFSIVLKFLNKYL